MSDNELWLCECGERTPDISDAEEHCEEEGHIAEKVDLETGERKGLLAVHFRDGKYRAGVPSTAQINREGYKNDPLFPRW